MLSKTWVKSQERTMVVYFPLLHLQSLICFLWLSHFCWHCSLESRSVRRGGVCYMYWKWAPSFRKFVHGTTNFPLFLALLFLPTPLHLPFHFPPLLHHRHLHLPSTFLSFLTNPLKLASLPLVLLKPHFSLHILHHIRYTYRTRSTISEIFRGKLPCTPIRHSNFKSSSLLIYTHRQCISNKIN